MGGHGILCPPVWKSWGDTSAVSPTKLRPWNKWIAFVPVTWPACLSLILSLQSIRRTDCKWINKHFYTTLQVRGFLTRVVNLLWSYKKLSQSVRDAIVKVTVIVFLEYAYSLYQALSSVGFRVVLLGHTFLPVQTHKLCDITVVLRSYCICLIKLCRSIQAITSSYQQAS